MVFIYSIQLNGEFVQHKKTAVFALVYVFVYGKAQADFDLRFAFIRGF